MHILTRPVPACLAAFALVGITKPTIFANTLKHIANIPTYIKSYEDIKNSISRYPQKEDSAEAKVIKKQETEEETENG